MAPCCAVTETEEILGVAEQGTALTVSFPKLPVGAVLIAVPMFAPSFGKCGALAGTPGP